MLNYGFVLILHFRNVEHSLLLLVCCLDGESVNDGWFLIIMFRMFRLMDNLSY
ncbi:hypothetical protein MANES_09G036350v8 [Manihot esculenta]|uniref:Uncharacterized protein n=1 Tax=Manihot esculenta TaxID=3983 RepID=A0ACB7H2H3_MANES|nr:hypothetical protein MANES_09G036350v8 [Manihot esculenta]